MTLTNPLTNDVLEYYLKGIVREPMAQEHLIIKCVKNLTFDNFK